MAKRDKRARKQASTQGQAARRERPISDAYPEIDNDLARDNLENDIPECDLPD